VSFRLGLPDNREIELIFLFTGDIMASLGEQDRRQDNEQIDPPYGVPLFLLLYHVF
jgi:hypothetical protein